MRTGMDWGRYIAWGKYKIRTCRYLNSCMLCEQDIRSGEQYYDGGYGRRAHVECVKKARATKGIDYEFLARDIVRQYAKSEKKILLWEPPQNVDIDLMFYVLCDCDPPLCLFTVPIEEEGKKIYPICSLDLVWRMVGAIKAKA